MYEEQKMGRRVDRGRTEGREHKWVVGGGGKDERTTAQLGYKMVKYPVD